MLLLLTPKDPNGPLVSGSPMPNHDAMGCELEILVKKSPVSNFIVNRVYTLDAQHCLALTSIVKPYIPKE